MLDATLTCGGKVAARTLVLHAMRSARCGKCHAFSGARCSFAKCKALHGKNGGFVKQMHAFSGQDIL